MTLYQKFNIFCSYLWEGEVDVYALSGDPKATAGYAWAAQDGNKSDITAVLKIPPVKDPITAVRASIVARPKGV